MIYNNPEILSFDAKYIQKNLDYFYEEYSSFFLLSKKIELIGARIKENYFFPHPNITLLAGGLKYDKDIGEFSTDDVYKYWVDTSSLYERKSSASLDSIESLVFDSNVSESYSILDDLFLKKGLSEENVQWSYDFSGSQPAIDSFTGDEIPNISYVVENFYQVSSPIISSLQVSFCLTDISVVNMNYMNSNVNRKHSQSYTTASDTLKSQSFDIVGNKIVQQIASSHVSSTSSKTEFKSDYSVATYDILNSISIPVDITGIKTFTLDSIVPYSTKNPIAIVNKEELSIYADEMLERRTNSFSDDFGAEKSDIGFAYTWRDTHFYLSAKISIFFTKSIDDFIKNGSSSSIVKNINKYIDDLISSLKSGFIGYDECSSLSPNNTDEKCISSCEQLDVNSDHEMVSKQKVKMYISCILDCDET